MESKIDVEFPCGYKYHWEIKTNPFEMGSFDNDNIKECPLHGKNCPPKK